MASRGQTITLCYYAYDTTNSVGKTGDAANHTLRWVKDGTSAVPTNVPSVEVDATNCKGLYKLVMTATECTANFGALHGVSSTSGVVLTPVLVTFEQLPTAAPNADAGLPILSASGTTLGYTLTSLSATERTAVAAAWGASVVGNSRTRDMYLQGLINRIEFAADGLSYTLYASDDLTVLAAGVSTRFSTAIGGPRSMDPT